MLVRRYVVKDMPEAVVLIRKDLGKDAVILSTKRLVVKKWFGLWRNKRLEVIAATGDDVPLKATAQQFQRLAQGDMALKTSKEHQVVGDAPAGPGVGTALQTEPATPEAIRKDSRSGRDIPVPTLFERNMDQGRLVTDNSIAVQGMDAFKHEIDGLRRELDALKTALGPQSERSSVGDVYVRRLLDHGVDENQARRLLEDIQPQSLAAYHMNTELAASGEASTDEESQMGGGPENPLQAALFERIEAELKELESVQPIGGASRTVAFVGPTGVGKTTTIAKIAALHVLSGKRKVGLVTTDTFRVAATDQLRTYASILNIPMQVVYHPEDLSGILGQMADRDLILIDTAGRNYSVDTHFQEAERLLQSADIDETFLVLSMTTKPQDLNHVAARFCRLPVDKFLFTKMDETSTYGAILNLLLKYRKPLSYFTTGQNVPDDIEVASIAKILKRILGGAA